MVTNNYKGWIGIYEYDAEYSMYHGRLLNTTDIITFEGHTINDLQKDFQDAVDDYLDFRSVI